MTPNELQSRLQYLLEKEKKYQFIKDAFFETKAEAERFQNDNKTAIEELKDLMNEKEEIKWQLMSEKEKKKHLNYLEKIKDKYSDD